MIIFSRSLLARKAELNLKLYGETLKIYPQVKFLGIIFDSKLTFQPHFEDILERCNSRYYRLQLLANKKWRPSPTTLIQIYKQCVRPIFEHGSLSTITVSDNIISKIQRFQNKFIRLALRLPKYIIPKLLHDSAGLPYVKDRLLSCATKSLDRIAQNPRVDKWYALVWFHVCPVAWLKITKLCPCFSNFSGFFAVFKVWLFFENGETNLTPKQSNRMF